MSYTELAYIEATGTQYIDLGFKLNQNHKVDIKFASSGLSAIFGSRRSADSNNIGIANSAGTIVIDFSNGNTATYRLMHKIIEATPYRVVSGKDGRYLYDATGNLVASNTVQNSQTIQTPGNAYLFYMSYNANGWSISTGQVYYCKVYENDVLIHDFIPVLDEDNVACLYDKVSETYFYNQGSGSFSIPTIVDTGLGWLCRDDYLIQSTSSMATINKRNYYKVNSTPAICFIRKPPSGYVAPALISTDASAVSYYADSGGPWEYNAQFKYLGLTWYYFSGTHGWQDPTISSSYAYYDFSSWEDDLEAEMLQVLSDALVSLAFERFYLVRDANDKIYTITDGALTALTETEVTASLFRTYGVDEAPDGSLLLGLTDPEVLYWHDSEDELPTLTITVTGTPPLPQVFTSEPMDLTHESIAGINYAVVDASEDVRFAITFDDGVTWKAFDGTSWFTVSDEAPGMLASTFNAVTAEQWAEVVTLGAYRVRFWLPNVTAYVASVVIHYINP